MSGIVFDNNNKSKEHVMNRIIFFPISLFFLFSCADYDLLDEDNALPAVELSVKSVRDSTVTLSWTQCSDENFKNYKIYCDSSDVVDQGDKLVDSLSFAQDTVKSINTLAPATMYWFRVVLLSQQGKITPSNTVSAVTWLAWRSPQWKGDSAVALAYSKVRNVSVSGYRVFSDTTDNIDSADTVWARLPETDTAITVNDLDAGTKRWFRAYAMADTGYLAPSTTLSLAGWAFTQQEPEKQTDTSAILRWSKPKIALSGYKVFYATTSPVDTADSVKAELKASDTSWVIGNLAKGTVHLFKIYAIGSNGYIAWTREKGFKVE